MSLKSTKEQLIQLLADNDNKVIALSGKWGTGKSFMWEEIKKNSTDQVVKSALYTSLFGITDIEQVKFKLIQCAAPSVEANPDLWKSAMQKIESGIKVLRNFHKGFNAFNDLGLLFAPAMLRNKLIVLDDIERKSNRLNIDEILGFIDEFTQQHSSKFLLIFNSDQLQERESWDVLREKVVDQELALKTSSVEAFEIAKKLTPSAHANHIYTPIEICGLTNIRIIRKIIKAVNRILGERHDLSDAVLFRVIPSIVLLSAIHFKGIENGPSFDFVLVKGATRDMCLVDEKDKSNSEEEKKLNSKWNLLMNELGIRSCDNFELLIVEFLQSGLFDVSKVSDIIDRYVSENDAMNARNSCNNFFDKLTWHHNLTEDELLSDAKDLLKEVHLLDPYFLTSLHEAIEKLPSGKAVADSALNIWLDAFTSKNHNEVNVDNFFQLKLHPKIEAKFNSINAKAQANTSVFEACADMVENRGWGTRQEIALKSATIQEIESIIRTKPIKELKLFMGKMVDLCINQENYEKHFGSAMDNFTQACRNIVQDQTSKRLGELIKTLFKDSHLDSRLNGPERNGDN